MGVEGGDRSLLVGFCWSLLGHTEERYENIQDS